MELIRGFPKTDFKISLHDTLLVVKHTPTQTQRHCLLNDEYNAEQIIELMLESFIDDLENTTTVFTEYGHSYKIH